MGVGQGAGVGQGVGAAGLAVSAGLAVWAMYRRYLGRHPATLFLDSRRLFIDLLVHCPIAGQEYCYCHITGSSYEGINAALADRSAGPESCSAGQSLRVMQGQDNRPHTSAGFRGPLLRGDGNLDL